MEYVLRLCVALPVRIWMTHYIPPTPHSTPAPVRRPQSGSGTSPSAPFRAISPNYDCPHPEFTRTHSHTHAKLHVSKQAYTQTHSERSDGQVPQTAFPCVIRLSEPSPLSNLSPVALLGLNTKPAGYTTPLSVSVCVREPVCVSMYPQIQAVCVSNFSFT